MQRKDSLSLPSIAASDKNDPSRLPSYRETRRHRFHPYNRPVPVLVNEEDYLLVGFPVFFFPPLSSLTVPLFRTQFMTMNVSYWMFHLLYLHVALLRLSSSFFLATWFSNQSLIAPACAPRYWRVWRASPPKHGTRHCIWITRWTPFYSHCGPSLSFFLLPYFLDLVNRSLLLGLHAQPVDKNFVSKEPTTCKLLSQKVMLFLFCLRWSCIYIAPTFFSKGHACFILPCDDPVYILYHWCAHPALIMFKFKPASHLLFIVVLSFGLSLMVQLESSILDDVCAGRLY